MKTLIMIILISFVISTIFLIGNIQAQSKEELNVLQSRIMKLENADQEDSLKIVELEKQLEIQKISKEYFDMILTSQTSTFAGIISAAILVAAVLSVGGYFWQVNSIKNDLKIRMNNLEEENRKLIKESNEVLLKLKITSEYQWGNLSIVISKNQEDIRRELYFLIKATSHFCKHKSLLLESEIKKDDIDLIVKNLDAAIAIARNAIEKESTPNEIIESQPEKNWKEMFSILLSDKDYEVVNKATILHTILYAEE